MKHIFQASKDKSKPTFILLHGTGGSERDFLSFAKQIEPDANRLGIKGNVDENGMARFFARIAEGQFDEDDLIFRTTELNDFVNNAANKYQFDRENVIAMGYSNGANIAASLLFRYADAIKGAILFHPMVPQRGLELPDLTGLPVFIGAGLNDPLCPVEETKDLVALLTGAGADVSVHWTSQGHQISESELTAAIEWFSEKIR